ncbi:hypothetical protein [Nocardioides sp. cx-173]|uniref:hypothetical protein n=1 Tax=Nocardioides sp. cx-173 TaxID=2898796 RepID=UPI001E63B26F|nr:hypothetical protein [Nocardioides sp. cx-173]MCD4523668.1 hypothetical protein [Nocardioides sp. cx-173]UGB42001.1 hypothetical protein LQ940_00340 [Nocardioides sp. cx-173]
MTEEPGDRTLRRLARGRTSLVVLPLAVALVVTAALGAQLLWAELPDTDAAEASTLCWDGAQVDDAGDCGMPTGPRGLRWVFPSFRPGSDDCRDVRAQHRELGRRTMWECEFEITGSPIVITYSELASGKVGRAALELEYADGQRRTVKAKDGTPLRHEWRRELPSGGFEVTVVYAAHPYAVQVRAEERALREAALRSTVRYRDPETMSSR